MYLVKIDAISIQTFETGFAAFNNVKATVANSVLRFGHSTVHLRSEKDIVSSAISLQGMADKLFRSSLSVDVGSIEKIDPLSDGVIDDFTRVCPVGLLTKHHATQNKWAYINTSASK